MVNNLMISRALLLLAALLAGSFPSHAQTPTPSPVVYLVYSGTGSVSNLTAASTTPVKESHKIYAVISLPRFGGFSLMDIKGTSYSIYTRVPSADGTSLTTYDNGTSATTDSVQNFSSAVIGAPKTTGGTPTVGYGTLRFSTPNKTTTVSSQEYADTTEILATGPMTGVNKLVTIVPANTKAKKSGIYTINPVASARTNNLSATSTADLEGYASSLTGPFYAYQYNPDLVITPVSGVPAVRSLSVAGGTVSLKLDTALTALANAGGSYTLNGQTTTVDPIGVPLSSTSSFSVYEKFLFQVALSQGLTPGYTPTSTP